MLGGRQSFLPYLLISRCERTPMGEVSRRGSYMATTQELFRDKGLLVRKTTTESRVCVVTFSPYVNTNERTLDRPGFGEGFLLRRQIDGIHVICRENKWYHEPGVFDAIAEIVKCSSSYDRVVTYGSSMGGYAAIHFAGLIGVHNAIAFSPQFSIQQGTCQFERRWRSDIEKISFIAAIECAPKLSGVAYLFYDPHDSSDRRHAEMFAAKYCVCLVPLPYSGHSAATFLNENGLLVPAVIDIVFDRFDAQALTLQVLERVRSREIRDV